MEPTTITSSHWISLKKETLSWKDTNLEFINSPEAHQAQASAALLDPSFTELQTNPGLQIWRIEQFKLIEWTKPGQFYSGDSYLVLNIIENENNKKQYDIHFWIGLNSSQDEYATAAYKSVELDNLLGGSPTIHREVQNYESEKFIGYFPEFKILRGGIASGFKHVEAEAFEQQLMRIKRVKETVLISQIEMEKNNLESSDVFIMDLGDKIYQLNGSNANKDEKFTAAQLLSKIKGERAGVITEILEENEWEQIEEIQAMQSGENQPLPKITPELEAISKKLFIVKEEDNNTQFKELECAEKLTKSLLDPNDSFIIDINTHLYVWIGENSSKNEKKFALSYATVYLQSTPYPVIPITVIKSGFEPNEFWQYF